jgi:hypothetical protein
VRREAGRQFDPAVIGALERGVLRGEIELGGDATTGEARSTRSRRRRVGGAAAPVNGPVFVPNPAVLRPDPTVGRAL